MEQLSESAVFELAKKACRKHGVTAVALACETSRKEILLYVVNCQRPDNLDQLAVCFDRLVSNIPAVTLHITAADGFRSRDCGLWLDRRIHEVGGLAGMGRIFGVNSSAINDWISRGVPEKYVPTVLSVLGAPDAPKAVSRTGSSRALRCGFFETDGTIDTSVRGVVSARRIINSWQ